MPLSTIFSYIVAVSFIGGGNRSTRRKPHTCHNSLTDFITLLYPRSPKGEGGILFYLCPSFRPSKIFFVAYFSITVDGRNLIFSHKRHIGLPYCGQRFWTHQIPTSCLPILLIFIHIEHICSFFVAFFSATIDGRNLIFGHKLHICTPISWEAFLDPSDSYFLFAEERGYHR